LRIEATEFASLDERGNDRAVFSAAVGTGQERVLAIEGVPQISIGGRMQIGALSL
jgi:hypothetical protein